MVSPLEPELRVAAVSTVKQAVMFSAAYLINNTLRVFSSCICAHGG